MFFVEIIDYLCVDVVSISTLFGDIIEYLFVNVAANSQSLSTRGINCRSALFC